MFSDLPINFKKKSQKIISKNFKKQEKRRA